MLSKRKHASRIWCGVALFGLALAVGCQGKLSLSPGSNSLAERKPTPSGSQPGAGTVNGTGSQPPPGTGMAAAPLAPGASARFNRLTHTQWRNATAQILQLDPNTTATLSNDFSHDPLGANFDTYVNALTVTPSLYTEYQEAAAELARQAVANPTFLESVGVTSDTKDKNAFIATFGRRAFRRSLTADEISKWTTLFDRGTELTGNPDPFLAGVQLTVNSMLQSSSFLYRIEAGTTVRNDGRIALSGLEAASKLSLALLNTTPDDALLAAAENGELDSPAGVRTWAQKLLSSTTDTRAADTIASFHLQYLLVANYQRIYKDPQQFDFPKEVIAALAAETQLFVREVAAKPSGALRELLTANYSYVNKDTAHLYGLQLTSFPDDGSFKRINLNSAQRSGVFTQLGFLALYGDADESDPIHRGVYLNRNLICANLPNPPPNVPALKPSATLTNRARVNALTGPGTCGASCHGTLINPIGFAFENYSTTGAWQTKDHGQTIDSSATYSLDGAPVSYNNALELMGKLAASPQVHKCYSKKWAQFLLGRDVTATDQALIDTVGAASLGGASVNDIILAFVTSKEFLSRAVDKPN